MPELRSASSYYTEQEHFCTASATHLLCWSSALLYNLQEPEDIFINSSILEFKESCGFLKLNCSNRAVASWNWKLKMALAHKVVVTVLFILFFLVFVAVRLDNKVGWNWFIVFIPLWLFDVTLLGILVLRMVSHCRIGGDMQNDTTVWEKIWYFSVIFLKFSFQIMLCVRLQFAMGSLPLYYVMLPMWILLTAAVVRLFPWSTKFRWRKLTHICVQWKKGEKLYGVCKKLISFWIGEAPNEASQLKARRTEPRFHTIDGKLA